MKFDNLMERLEAYRRGNGITKAEFSRILGCNSQHQYQNWINRGSLPKAYYDTALRVLGNSGSLTKDQIALLKKIDTLADQDKKTVLRLIDALLASHQ